MKTKTVALAVAMAVLVLPLLARRSGPAPGGNTMSEGVYGFTMKANDGKYICVIEGAIPVKEDGNFCRIADKTALELTKEIGGRAAAIIAIGSCASWGGVPSASPNPTGAVGVHEVLRNKPIVNIPGCPANPYNLLGTVLQFATFGTLPALDDKGRPKFAYARVIHDDCPRRPHFDAGRFVQRYGDDGARQGWCLYKIGCKGPKTPNNCSLLSYVDTVGAWPIGVGAQCFGCSEKGIGFTAPLFSTIDVQGPTPPAMFTPIDPQSGTISPVATGVAGLVGGALVGAGLAYGAKLSKVDSAEEAHEEKKS